MNRKVPLLFLSATLMTTANAYADKMDDYADYCNKSGGIVEEMPVEIGTQNGMVTGQSKSFCNFNIEHGFVAVGLETFSAVEPSIAATFMKTMGSIAPNSPLWKGKYTNPSHNACKNLGGATLGFVASGGFANQLGQSDICVFGDGSMVSGWSLIYMANHAAGYDEIKDKVKAEPLDIDIPR